MAHIDYADEANNPDPKLIEMYDRLRDPRHGQVDNILRIHGHNPPSLTAHMGLYKTLMFGRSPLSRARREMIAVAVSRTNGCHY